MHILPYIFFASSALAMAAEPIVPIEKFSALCSEMGIYAFDREEDAWILRNRLKGDPPRVNARWDTRILGPRPRIKPNEGGYYRLYFEIEQRDELGQVWQTKSQSLNNTISGTKLFFEIESLPKWVFDRLGLPTGSDMIIIALPKNPEVRPKRMEGEQAGTGQPATRPESKSEGGDKPQPEAEGRSR
jgi:hypothetical protein